MITFRDRLVRSCPILIYLTKYQNWSNLCTIIVKTMNEPIKNIFIKCITSIIIFFEPKLGGISPPEKSIYFKALKLRRGEF